MKRWIGTILACGWVLGLAVGTASSGEKVLATMSYIFHGGHAPFFSALGTGRYKEQGLDVTIQRGYGSKATITTIFGGKSHFGEAGMGTTIVSRSRGVNVKQVGMIYHNDQSEVVTLKSSGIRTPADFKGRRVADVPASSTRTIFPALLARNNLKESDINFISMTAAALGPSLLAGKVDMFLTFAVTAAPLKLKAKSMGKELVEIPYGEHGLPFYGNGIVASEALIKSNPDLVRRIVKATLEAMVWAVDNPEAATRHLVSTSPSLSYSAVLEQWKTTIRFVVTPESIRTGLGFMEEKKVAFTKDIISRYMKGKLGPREVKVKDVYTNRFIPGKLVPKSAM
ncbi:MAG: ABC transporter substrate-binding protein [Nitrospinota bacterium]